MIPRSMSSVAHAVDGLFLGQDVEVSSVVTDSRLSEPGSLFVALPGERTDGGLFVGDAFAHGAAGVLVRDNLVVDGPAVFVRSTGEALLRLAADERNHMSATVVAITGANGKTTTKDMTWAVLRERFRTHASPLSFNNEIGLPITLLGAPEKTEVVVAEMGARHTGDVDLLCRVARPEIAVVTNVGVAHMEVFGSFDKIVQAAAEPVAALGSEGLAILNADDPDVASLAQDHPGRTITFGLTASADVRAADVKLDDQGCATFLLESAQGQAEVTLGVPGQHMVPNALAAGAVGMELGIGPEECANALGEAGISKWRMESFTTPSGIRVLNDAYNANPESMAAALRTARWMAGDHRLIAVLGTMAELGPISLEEHHRVGELAARLRVDRLITVGADAEPIAVAGLREGVEPDRVASYVDPDEALADVRSSAEPGDVVLVKASRVAGLETIAEALG